MSIIVRTYWMTHVHCYKFVFFPGPLKFSFILILCKLNNSYICQLGKGVIHRLKLSIMLAYLGQLAVEILVIL